MCLFFQKCSDYQTSTLSNFARLEPPDTQVKHRLYFFNSIQVLFMISDLSNMYLDASRFMYSYILYLVNQLNNVLKTIHYLLLNKIQWNL